MQDAGAKILLPLVLVIPDAKGPTFFDELLKIELS